MNKIGCLQCMTVDPISELAAVAEVRKADRTNPGYLAYYPCVNGGFHLTITGKRDDARRPKDMA